MELTLSEFNFMNCDVFKYQIIRMKGFSSRRNKGQPKFLILLSVLAIAIPLLNSYIPKERFISSNNAIWINNQQAHNAKGCTLCNFVPPRRNGNSTPRDLILTFALGKLQNALAFVSSCRTTGCQARIVFLVDDVAHTKYSQEFYQELYNCGCEIINVGHFDIKDRQDIFFIRYLYYEKYLSNRTDIDRILATDLYDVLFQSDPFTNEVTGKKVFFFSEREKMADNWYNQYYITTCYDNLETIEPSKNKDKLKSLLFEGDIINAGISLGGYGPMLKFIKFMTKIGNRTTLQSYADDQGCLNLFLRGHFFDDIFEYEIDPFNGTLIECFGSRFIKKSFELAKHPLGSLPHPDNPPAVIHQIDRNQYIPYLASSVCPVDILDQDLGIQVKIHEHFLAFKLYAALRAF